MEVFHGVTIIPSEVFNEIEKFIKDHLEDVVVDEATLLL